MRSASRQALGRLTSWRSVGPASEAWLVQTGIGELRAASAATVIAGAARFDLFLVAGCAGALDARLRPGDLVVASAVVAEGRRYYTDPAFQARAEEICRRRLLPWYSGALLTSPEAIGTVAARQRAAANTGAIAVEMEASGIARTAQAHGIAFAEVRAVLDTADVELHQSGDFIDPETGRLRPSHALRFVATNPGGAARLLALRRMMVASHQALTEFFAEYLS